jgi:hypothetical protein
MLTVALMEQVPTDTRVGREMTTKLDPRNRPEPDLLVTTADFDVDRTGAYAPASTSSHRPDAAEGQHQVSTGMQEG